MTAPRNPVGSYWFTALNGLICGFTGFGIFQGTSSLPLGLTVILLAAQCEMIRWMLRQSEKERLLLSSSYPWVVIKWALQENKEN